MKKGGIAEVLYYVTKIEKLLDTKGAVGESFSDKVKSLNTLNKLEKPSTFEKPVIASQGHKFYYKNGTYHIKQQYKYENSIEGNLDSYISYKWDVKVHQEEWETYKKRVNNQRKERKQLLGGHYNNLIRIAHERNQLLHIHNYTIENFRTFKRACRDVITYLEGGKWLSFPVVTLTPQAEVLQAPFKTTRKLHWRDRSKLALAEEFFPTFVLITVLNMIFFIIVKYSERVHLSTKETIIFAFFLTLLAIMMKIGMFGQFFKFQKGVLVGLFGAIKKMLSSIVTVGSVTTNIVATTFAFLFEMIALLISLSPVIIAMGVLYLFFIKPLFSPEEKDHHASTLVSKTPLCSYYRVTAQALNIRLNHSSSAKKAGIVNKDAKLCVTQKYGNWFYVDKKGWVYGKHTKQWRK